MTTLALTRRQTKEAHTTNKVTATARAIARWMKIRRDRRLLQAMPDYLLSDIGISRGAIDGATRFGRAL